MAERLQYRTNWINVTPRGAAEGLMCTTAARHPRSPAAWAHRAAALLLGIGLAACSAGSTPSPGATLPGSTASDPPRSADVEPSEAATSPDAAPSAFPSGQGIGDPIGPPELAVGDWVVSTVEDLRLRQAPGLDGASIGLMRIGFEGTVIEGPMELDGYEWAYVAWPGLPAGSGCATGTDDDGYLRLCGTSGWVATADPYGNAWVAATTPDCPEVPNTVADASQIRPGVLLACFAGEELELTGYIAPEAGGRGCFPGYDVDPAWLGPCAIAFLQGEESQFDATGSEVAVNVDPSLGTCHFGGDFPDTCPFATLGGSWVTVSGMVDHAAAESCVIEPVEGNENAPDAATAVYACRERFVVSAVEPGTAP